MIINDDLNLKGWNSRHDEKIPHADALMRFKDHTIESAAKAKVKAVSIVKYASLSLLCSMNKVKTGSSKYIAIICH